MPKLKRVRSNHEQFAVTVEVDRFCSGGLPGHFDILISIVTLMKEHDGRQGIRCPSWGYSSALSDGISQRIDHCCEGLQARISIDLKYPTIQTWARKLTYCPGYSKLDLAQIDRTHRTMKRIDKEMAKSAPESSRTETAGQWAYRIADAVGARTLAVMVKPAYRGRDYSKEIYEMRDLEEIIPMVDEMMYDLIKKESGEAEANRQVEEGYLAPYRGLSKEVKVA